MNINDPVVYRLDPLTGCHNFLSFVETLHQLTCSEKKEPFSMLYVDMNGLANLNESMGETYGDSAIRWFGLALSEVTNSVVFRTGSDEFAVILRGESCTDKVEIASRFISRMEIEAGQFGLPSPAAGIVLISYREEQKINPVVIFSHMGQSMLVMKNNRDKVITYIDAIELKQPEEIHQEDWRLDTSVYNPDWLAHLALSRIISLGAKLDEANEMAFTDVITGLPNMRDAVKTLDSMLIIAKATNKPFSVLLMDGDNLRIYNNDNYAEGDMMLRDLSSVLRKYLRPDDYIARWRSGDEFIAILPAANVDGAIIVAERFRQAIKEESKSWKYPISISIGVSTFPIHGKSNEEIIQNSEKALKLAKEQGKDKVVVFQP